MPRTKAANRRSSDLALLCSTVAGLFGKKCWNVAFTYGGELTLHFGRHVPYGVSQMAGKSKGEWMLGTRGTAWRLFTPSGVISSDSGSEECLEGQAKVLEGRKVTNLSVTVPDNVLTLAFGTDHLFLIIPAATDDKHDLPYWELFMPAHQLVAFGPGSRWAISRSDLPVS